MRNLEDTSAFIDALSGRQEHIADYLTDEVIARQPEDVISFLLQTSILEHLTAPLCEAVTGQASAQETLEYLVEGNLFIVPLDERQEWYRYHTLFADLLRKRLYTANREQVDEFHCRASHWYGENGFFSQAIDHALVGVDFERAAGMIERLAEDGLAHGQTVTLLRWLETLPAEIKDKTLLLWVYQGLALMMGGQPDQPVRAALERHSGSPEEEAIQGEIAVLRALQAVLEGNTAEAVSRAEFAMQKLPSDRSFFRSLAADCLGMAYTLQGNVVAAISAFEEVKELSTRAGNDMMVILALSNLAGLHSMRGQLRTSEAIYQRVIDMAEDRFGKHSSYTGKALLGLGELAREWNNLETALRYFYESITAFQQFSEIGLGVSYLSIARVKLSQRDWGSVQEYILKARHTARDSKSTHLDDLLTDLMEARYWIARGELGLAMEWANSRGLLDHSVEEMVARLGQNAAIGEIIHRQFMVLARLFLAREQPVEALRVIEPLLVNSVNYGHNRRVIEYLVLKALALQLLPDPVQSLEVIGEALRLGEAEGFQRVFLDEGKSMAQLLYRAVERGIYPLYAGKILSGLSALELISLAREVKGFPHEALVLPLSEREKEVLALIADGLSNGEIAGRLYISLSTVKGHIAHIFGKLGVKSRTQAVSLARDIGLIPDRPSSSKESADLK
jgi:LuxR family maltose regulon positive regulatory protein